MRKCAILFLGSLAACNYDTGECYVRGQEGAGAGGTVVTQPGTGGFGDVPPKPQDAADLSADPCSAAISAECVVTWQHTCDSQGSGSSCATTAQYRCAHATLEDAKKECERVLGVGTAFGAQSCGPCKWTTSANNDCLDLCKDQCVDIWEGCYDKCGKDHVCREKCMNQLIECNKKCEEKCK